MLRRSFFAALSSLPVVSTFFGKQSTANTEPSANRMDDLDEMIEVLCRNGTGNYDEYSHGMANGAIFARSVLTKTEPEYLEAPEKWLSDFKPTVSVTADDKLTDSEAMDEFKAAVERACNTVVVEQQRPGGILYRRQS